MIFKTEITDYIGTVFKTLGDHVVNTDRIIKPRSVNGSASQFWYTDRGYDRRSQPLPVYCDATLAEVKSEMDSVLNSNRMELRAFINNDITQDTLSKFIDYRYFIHAHSHRLDSSYSWITFIDGFRLTKVLVDNTLDELVSTANGGVDEGDDVEEWTDGVARFRLKVRDRALFLDQTITNPGFNGVEDIDWASIWEKKLSTTAPTIISASIENLAKNYLKLIFSEQMNTTSSDPGDFTLKVGGAGDLIAEAFVVEADLITVYINLTRPVVNGEVLTLDYAGDSWIDLNEGVDLIPYTDHSVTNNVT